MESDDAFDYAITSIKRNGVAIKGNIETKSEQAGIVSRNIALRNELDLFVNVLHCKSYPGVRSHHQDVDLFVIRQNTEGEYAMLGEVRFFYIYFNIRKFNILYINISYYLYTFFLNTRT